MRFSGFGISLRRSTISSDGKAHWQCRPSLAWWQRSALAGRAHGKLGRVIVEAMVLEYGRDELLRRLAHPFWFQSFGAVMGMDWHASGITTSVLGALKRGLAPLQHELGIYVCGGKGARSRRTPLELTLIGERTGLDAASLTHASRLVAKVDSAAVQDGFDLYLHGFIVTAEGRWCVIQQGMNEARREARRYHWLSENLQSFVDSPHTAIEGRNQGAIVNLADARAERNRRAGVELVRAGPDQPVTCCAGGANQEMQRFRCFRIQRRRSIRCFRSCACRRTTMFVHPTWCSGVSMRRSRRRPTVVRAISSICS
jgi:hypothetical protein